MLVSFLRKVIPYVSLTLFLAGVSALPLLAQATQNSSSADQDPLAEAARKAKEQKKQEPKPAKVFTNDDVSSLPPSAKTTAAAPNEGEKKPADESKEKTNAQSKEGKTEEASSAGKADEATWRSRFAEARRKLSDAQTELDILQRELSKTEEQYYADPQKSLEQQYSRKDINDKETQIAAKKEEIQKLQDHLSDLEDQMRKEGGDPGWAREQ